MTESRKRNGQDDGKERAERTGAVHHGSLDQFVRQFLHVSREHDQREGHGESHVGQNQARKDFMNIDSRENDEQGNYEDDSREHLCYKHERGKRGASDRLFPDKPVGGRRGDEKRADRRYRANEKAGSNVRPQTLQRLRPVLDDKMPGPKGLIDSEKLRRGH